MSEETTAVVPVAPVKLTSAMNPMRRPAWRWDRIGYLVAKNTHGRSRTATINDDQYVAEGRKYLSQYNLITRDIVRTGTPVDLDMAFSALYTQWPTLALAHKIYIDRNFARWAIEAMVLTKLPAEVLARELGCAVGVITDYERYFYDVRDRLDNELFIIDALLSPAMKFGMAGTDYDFFWKGVAYWYNIDVLRALWTMGAVSTDVKTKLGEVISTMMERNTLRASVARQPNQFNAHEMLDEHLTQKQIDADKGLGGGINQMLKDSTVQLSSAIKLSVASMTFIAPGGGKESRATNAIRRLAEAIPVEPVVADPIVRKDASVPVPASAPVIAPPITPAGPEDHVKSTVFTRPEGSVAVAKVAVSPEQDEKIKGIHAKKDLIIKRIKSKKG